MKEFVFAYGRWWEIVLKRKKCLVVRSDGLLPFDRVDKAHVKKFKLA